MSKKFYILSPDGISIECEKTYSSISEAKEAFNNWKKRYERQGYYSSNRGRISLDELEDNCTFVEISKPMKRYKVEVIDSRGLQLDSVFIEAANKVDAIRKVKDRMKVYRLKVSKHSFKARLTNKEDSNSIGYLLEFGD